MCEGYDTLTALDINTKQQLWRLPDTASGRVKPKLHSAFHGLVYTKGQRGPVVLDARTGQDSVIDATIAPVWWSQASAWVKEDKQLFAYAATG